MRASPQPLIQVFTFDQGFQDDLQRIVLLLLAGFARREPEVVS